MSSMPGKALPVAEGLVDVGEARLSYRLVNAGSAGPTLVFENGWGASFHYWAWMEKALQEALGDTCRMLFYDRAGIGGSSTSGPITVAGMTQNLAALLKHLRIDDKVILVGHSYGGLMVGLHAAVAPERVEKAIQLDPTPELDDPSINKQLAAVKLVGNLAQVCAHMGVRDPIFSPACRELPTEAGRQLQKLAFGNARSLKHALAELELMSGIRAAIAQSPATPTRPLLVVSAGKPTVPEGKLWSLFAGAEKARQIQQSMFAIHQAQAQSSSRGRWDSLPFAHGVMVLTEAGASASAARISEEIA
jgi:pimeloyl-ACP methyl ester carboxylesterase